MAVPDFQTLMLPVLREFADGKPRPTREVRERVARALELSEQDLGEMLASGHQSRFANRTAWAHVYLKQAGLLDSVRRGTYQITERGRSVLESPPDRITIPYLMRFPEFVAFRNVGGSGEGGQTDQETTVDAVAAELTPDEQIRIGYRRLRSNLAVQLLDRVKQASPGFFENLVVELLVAMGYGGSHEDAAKVVGRSGDGGIDGIIKEDRLGFDSIYVQAKRWENVVGRPTIQQFAGALQGQRARKGVVITTSGFTEDARRYAESLQTTIILIDGPQLAQFMIDFGVGVSEVEALKLVRVDEDYFGED